MSICTKSGFCAWFEAYSLDSGCPLVSNLI